MIKKDNVRVCITLTPMQVKILYEIKSVKGCKTYGKAIDYLFESYTLACEEFVNNIYRK